MQLTTDYYGFNATHLERLFLRIARHITRFQRNTGVNPNKLTAVTIETDETTGTVTITAEAQGTFNAGELTINNPFNDTLTSTGSTKPWNSTNHLEAMFLLGIDIANKEKDETLNRQSKFIVEYDITSNGDVVEPHVTVSLTATDIPLTFSFDGEKGVSTADPWLTGTIP